MSVRLMNESAPRLPDTRRKRKDDGSIVHVEVRIEHWIDKWLRLSLCRTVLTARLRRCDQLTVRRPNDATSAFTQPIAERHAVGYIIDHKRFTKANVHQYTAARSEKCK